MVMKINLKILHLVSVMLLLLACNPHSLKRRTAHHKPCMVCMQGKVYTTHLFDSLLYSHGIQNLNNYFFSCPSKAVNCYEDTLGFVQFFKNADHASSFNFLLYCEDTSIVLSGDSLLSEAYWRSAYFTLNKNRKCDELYFKQELDFIHENYKKCRALGDAF